MNTKTILGALAAVALLVAILIIAKSNQRVLEQNLPPRDADCRDMLDAAQRARDFASSHGGVVLPIAGTGSMAPYIPAARPGADPRFVIVAYAVTDPQATFADIEAGDLCIYRAGWDPKVSVIHGAAQRDREGWIMSGLHNSRSEPQWRVTPENFRGIVAAVFVWECK